MLAKVVVDCSGDGDLAARAGVAYRVGPKLVFRGGYALSYLGQNSGLRF